MLSYVTGLLSFDGERQDEEQDGGVQQQQNRTQQEKLVLSYSKSSMPPDRSKVRKHIIITYEGERSQATAVASSEVQSDLK